MKANQKFLKGDDEAVSPVIAVILMVAITVVLAATVYVWVSGFSGGQGSAAKSMALSSGGAIASNLKTYTVSSATQGMKWSDLKFTLDGTDLTYDGTDPANANFEFYVKDGAATVAGTSIPSTTVDAGDSIVIYHSALSRP
jgi:archaeal type IV pilus assembly protein PilA